MYSFISEKHYDIFGYDKNSDDLKFIKIKNPLGEDVSVMRTLQSKVNALVGQCSTPAGQQAVKKLSEELQYSDPVSSNAVAEAESELSACVDTLQQAVVDGDETAILELARKASLALAERNRMCKLNKQS